MNVRAHYDRAVALVHCVGGEVLAVLVRLTIGQAFMQSGLGKLNNHEGTTQFFTSLGIPAPGLHAWFIGGLELVGGALLLLGLGVRPVALLLLCTMAVALMTADRGAFVAALALDPEKGLTEVVPWMYGLLLLVLLAHGAGRLSLDRLIAARTAKSAAAPAQG